MDAFTALVVKAVATRATELVIREIMGFQDQQAQELQRIGGRLASMESALDALLQGPHRTARLWLSEAADASEGDEDQGYRLQKAREYLFEAYALATSPLSQSAISREVALVLALQGRDGSDWWRRAIEHGEAALSAAVEETRALVGVPSRPLNSVTAEMREAARSARRGLFGWGALSEQERFWRLASTCIREVERGHAKSAGLETLPAMRAIQGLLGIIEFNRATNAGAIAAGLPESRTSKLTAVVELQTTPSGRRSARQPRGVRIEVVDSTLVELVPLDELINDRGELINDFTLKQLLTMVGGIGSVKSQQIEAATGLTARKRVSTMSKEERDILLAAIRANVSKQRLPNVLIDVSKLRN